MWNPKLHLNYNYKIHLFTWARIGGKSKKKKKEKDFFGDW
jgi:hypothetical protein